MRHQNSISLVIRTVLVLGILFSIGVVYYTKIVQQDYVIFYSDDGIPVREE